jgi:hypothetical protein
MKTTLALLAVTGTLLLAGCGGADVVQEVSSVSQGTELTDLKRALDAGAINNDEYERLRRKILARK